MAIQEWLRETEELSSIIVLPLLGLEGLYLASRKDLTLKLQATMREKIGTFKKGFCDPVLKPSKVFSTHHDPGSRGGFLRLIADEVLLSNHRITPEELRRIISNASRVARRILSGKKVSKRALNIRMKDLQKFLDLAKAFCERHHPRGPLRIGAW